MSKLGSFLTLVALVVIVSYFGAAISASYLQMGRQVGVVQIVGPIYSFGDLTDQIGAAENDPRIRALVLYLNSPGGGAYACMEVRRYVENMTKPNIAIMDEVAASGAYYIGSAADEILAHANTITGSIGVISVWEDYSKWLENEGIAFHVWKSGQAKDLYEPWRSPTQEENETIQREIDKIYEELITDIARGRPNMTVEDVRMVANGSVYTGLEALEKGLVDGIGDYSSSIKKVASRVKARRYITRDMSLGDREVLAGLLVAYFTSEVTVVVIILLAVISVVKATIRRREGPDQDRIHIGGV